MRLNEPSKRLPVIITILCSALSIGILATLDNLHTSSPKHALQLTWYAEGVPEQSSVLAVDARADDQLSFRRWQNSRGLKTHSAKGTKVMVVNSRSSNVPSNTDS